MKVIKENKIDTRLFFRNLLANDFIQILTWQNFFKLMEVKTHPWEGSKTTGTGE